MGNERSSKKKDEEIKQQYRLMEKMLFRKDLKTILFIIGFILLLAIIIFIIIAVKKSNDERSLSERIEDTVTDIVVGQEGKVELVTEATLMSAMRDATLYTAEYPYNGVTYVYGKDGEGLKYYLSYKATIKAGFNMNNVRVNLDKDSNVITIYLPEIELSEPAISGDFRYIFMDEKYNNGDTYNESFQAAVTDMKRREMMGDFTNIYNAATDNAKITQRALVEPWVSQVDPDTRYTIKVLAYGEEENDE